MEIKKGDFVEINYTGKVQDTIYDTTKPEVAKSAGLTDKDMKPIRICVGKNALLKGIEEDMVGKEIGAKYTLKLAPEDAFGKKDAKNIQLVPTSKFKKEGMNPYPGMQVQIDGKLVVVKRVSGGRTLVDFNHPLAGQEVEYDIEILKEITDTKEKLDAFIPGDVEFKEGTATVSKFPEEMQSEIVKQIKESIPEIKDVKFKGE